jgi:hypothetical protein
MVMIHHGLFSYPIQCEHKRDNRAGIWRMFNDSRAKYAREYQRTTAGEVSGAGKIVIRDAIFSPDGNRKTNTL